MKCVCRLVFSALLCVCLMFLPVSAYAVDEENKKTLDELFEQVDAVLPDTQRDYSLQLDIAYTEAPYEYLLCLNAQDDHTLEGVSFFWLGSKSKAELELISEEIQKYPQEDFSRIKYQIRMFVSLRELDEKYAANQPGFAYDEAGFDVVRIKIRISDFLNDVKSNKECIISDSVLMAYEADPGIFSQMLSEYTDEEIKIIINYIAEKYARTKRAVPNVDYSTLTTSDYNYIIQDIQSSISARILRATENADVQIGTDLEVQSLLVPTIGAMSYTNADELEHGDTGSLNFTLSEGSAVGSVRQWWIEVYAVKDGAQTLIGTKSAYMTYGASTLSCIVPVDFLVAGKFYTCVKIYSEEGGTLVTQRTGAYPNTATGSWRIYVSLPEKRDNPGTLRFYDSYGNVLRSIVCLGKSASEDCPCIVEGDTPTGT